MNIQLAEMALKRYELLRKLLNTEFVLRPVEDETLIKAEWEQSLNILLSENCLHIVKDAIFLGNNTELLSILHNVITPFIDVIYVICNLLFEVRIKTYLQNNKNDFDEIYIYVENCFFSGLKEHRANSQIGRFSLKRRKKWKD